MPGARALPLQLQTSQDRTVLPPVLSSLLGVRAKPYDVSLKMGEATQEVPDLYPDRLCPLKPREQRAGPGAPQGGGVRRGLLPTGDPEALGPLQSQSKSLRPPATSEAAIRLLTGHLPFPGTLGAGCCPTSPGSQAKQAQRHSAVARAEEGLDSRPQPPGHQGGTASCGVSWGLGGSGGRRGGTPARAEEGASPPRAPPPTIPGRGGSLVGRDALHHPGWPLLSSCRCGCALPVVGSEPDAAWFPLSEEGGWSE